jgi:hypothetical protein
LSGFALVALLLFPATTLANGNRTTRRLSAVPVHQILAHGTTRHEHRMRTNDGVEDQFVDSRWAL